ncbi:DSK1 [Symbiodinium necroappetens]|uniref:DSK1 protein n=1 Tax=Symbiodinium necroappetens TaxID=1628268 RepID=A0A812KS40_9DINO|nr:DSK1 [Symbiodinium necroappetens]
MAGPAASNLCVYKQAAAPIIETSCSGGVGLLFMFGQTGSGKTHTMHAVHELAALEIFGSDPAAVGVQFLELRGDKAFDLLANPEGKSKTFPELRLREHAGAYHAEGAMELSPRSPEDMQVVLETAHARRRTASTGANAVSSRSHAVCLLRIQRKGPEESREPTGPKGLLGPRAGLLVLVDCAGSERKKDSRGHSKEQQQESAEINASLGGPVPRAAENGHSWRALGAPRLYALKAGGDLHGVALRVTTLRLGTALAGCCEQEEKARRPSTDHSHHTLHITCNFFSRVLRLIRISWSKCPRNGAGRRRLQSSGRRRAAPHESFSILNGREGGRERERARESACRSW